MNMRSELFMKYLRFSNCKASSSPSAIKTQRTQIFLVSGIALIISMCLTEELANIMMWWFGNHFTGWVSFWNSSFSFWCVGVFFHVVFAKLKDDNEVWTHHRRLGKSLSKLPPEGVQAVQPPFFHDTLLSNYSSCIFPWWLYSVPLQKTCFHFCSLETVNPHKTLSVSGKL